MKNLYIHRKSFIILLFLAAALACDVSRLDTPPLNLTEETYFSSEAEFRLALMNAYSKMTDWYWFQGGNHLHRMYHLPGDDITEESGTFATFELFSGINSTS